MPDCSNSDLVVGDFAGMTVEEIREKLENIKFEDPDAVFHKAEELVNDMFS